VMPGWPPPPPPDIESPTELLQCWQSFTQRDRVYLVRLTRLLTAADMFPPGADLLRLAPLDLSEKDLIQSRLSRQRQRSKDRKGHTEEARQELSEGLRLDPR
jgi:hypothetical protein